jgi:hypothetical protein
MSQTWNPDPGWEGRAQKEISKLGVGLNSQQQVSIVVPTSSDRSLAAALAFHAAKLLKEKKKT